MFSLLLQPSISETFKESYEDKAEPIFKLFYGFICDQGSKNPEKDLMAIASMLEGAFLYCVAAPEIFPMEQMEDAIIEASFRIIKNQ